MSDLVKIVLEGDPVPSWPPSYEVALKTKYEPDRFQKFAIEAIEAGDNVLITAKTGSGKTFVGEYQIAKSLSRGGRVFYTTPIKSLSNQKFHDLKELFPDASVGIMTGDIKFRPDAQILVMTTEILRNLLYKRGTKTESVGATSILSLEGLDAVVFDEVHYINDKDRGHVWEETLMLLPPEVKLVLLSATLSSPQLFARWLAGEKQRKIWVISTLWRAVPLTHCIRSEEGKLFTIYDSKEHFDTEVYRSWFVAKRDGYLAHDRFKEKVKDARRGGVEGPIEGKTRPKAFEHQLNELLDDLHRKEGLPAIVFQFSRVGCEKLAAKTQGTFIDTSDCAAVRHIWNFHLSRYNASLEKSPQYHKLYELVQRGIAFHHSGLIPFLKEILEILFNKGYIKLLYATETFAVGINMPTKTVIFTALDKFTDGSSRLLNTAEYIQMAGRAGRRGKDDKGLVIYLPQRDPLEVGEMRSLLTGVALSFCSRMSFGYDFVLKILNSGKSMKDLVEGSYWWALEKESLQRVVKELEDAEKKEKSLRQLLNEEQVAVCEAKEDIDKRIANSQNAKRKAAQKDLVKWQQENPEHRWKAVLERFSAWREASESKKQVESLHDRLKAQGSELPDVRRRVALLEEFGYVNSGTLCEKGVLASEINEGHPFLMTEMFLRLNPTIQTWDLVDLLVLLSLFLGEYSEKENPNAKHPNDLEVAKCVKEEIFKIDDDAAKFEAAERKLGLPDNMEYWSLNTEWMEPIQEWIEASSGESEKEVSLASIAQKYDLFEGNVLKALMSLASLVEELQSLATLTNSVHMLRLLEPSRELILRDVVIAESLYLRL
jgi:superfamily II RNA helicase